MTEIVRAALISTELTQQGKKSTRLVIGEEPFIWGHTLANGNVLAIYNNKDTSRTQSFTYDSLNRLTHAENSGTDCTQTLPDGHTEYWGNNYVYDAWGNLYQKNVTKCSAERLNVSASATNQLHTLSGPDYQYDAAGNMTHDPTYNVNYSFDPENRLSGAGGFTYTYDADGNRVEKSTGGSSPTGTLYWYGKLGIMAESDLSGNIQHEYIFFAGERVARKDLPGNTVSYYFADHLKTTAIVTNSSGTIKADSDYYPWGSELPFVNNDSNDYKFTGKKRDTESGLDYFGARYYGNWYGRFVTPDWSPGPATVPFARLDNPQTLNLYAYVDNNPSNGIDVDGHSPYSYMPAAVGDYRPYFITNGCRTTEGCFNQFDNLRTQINDTRIAAEGTRGAAAGANSAVTGASAVAKAQSQTQTAPELVISPDEGAVRIYPGGFQEIVDYKLNTVDANGNIIPLKAQEASKHQIELKEKLVNGNAIICTGNCVALGTLTDNMEVGRGSSHSVIKRFEIDGRTAHIYDPDTNKLYDFLKVDATAQTKPHFVLTFGNDSKPQQ